MEYDTLPFKTFFKILNDESKVGLLGLEGKKQNEKAWESIKAQYKEKHPSPKERRLVEAYKKVLRESIYANRDITLLMYLLTEPENLKELYGELKIQWHDDLESRAKSLETNIDKCKQKLEIFNAKLKQIEEDIEDEQEEKDIDISKINEAIASLTLYGFPINDFEKLTCGQYDAYSKVAQKKASQAKKNGAKG
jgi:hypothetical protein